MPMVAKGNKNMLILTLAMVSVKVQSSPLIGNLTGLYICKSGWFNASEQGNQSED